MLSTNAIRSTFLNYFKDNKHTIVPSSSLVPTNDPSLLFTNAGMVQFKNVFTGLETRPYHRATTAQKVVRAGGKHNDLDNVGYTARHHTFFEMMGNFSFGDYFKPVAIEFAWNLLTKVFKLSPEKLLVTVYADDLEAATLWKKIAGIEDKRIIRIPTADNFWKMGETGPCGPSSEIFYDHGPDVPGGPPGSPDEDGDRFVEIWNLVFMQYFEDPPGTKTPLPRPSIDTGMGLERFATIMQNKKDNYDIDLFVALIKAASELTHQKSDGPFKSSLRVVSDHLRSTAFLIADGVLPSREGRGYVLRRIMRRAMRHLHIMGLKEPAFYKLLPALIEQMGQAYPELIQSQSLIQNTMKDEETRFKTLLDRGLHLLADEEKNLRPGQDLPGEIVFKLYDTYGFPADLTGDVLREQGHGIDLKGFEAHMQVQRQRARAAWKGSGDSKLQTIWFNVSEKFGPTEFLGYKTLSSEANLLAMIHNNAYLDEANVGDEAYFVLDKTPFYGESGGQSGDTGLLKSDGVEIAISDTQKQVGDVIAHYGTVIKGTIKTPLKIEACVNKDQRHNIAIHHSATHLLHKALREKLGDHVAQKGSQNTAHGLRFDISHPKAMTDDEIRDVEKAVNAHIRQASPVSQQIMSKEDALKTGATSLFGEKYGDEVRVVSMGEDSKTHHSWSKELCGGTHVANTSQLGLFHIISESGVSSGVRRIEAVAGPAADRFIADEQDRLRQMASMLKVNPQHAPERLAALLEERKILEKKITSLQHQLATGQGQKQQIEKVGNYRLIARNVGETAARELKGLAETFLKQQQADIVILFSSAQEKGNIVVALGEVAQKKLDAPSIVRQLSPLMGGKGGGGRKNMAQAGGPHPQTSQAVFNELKEILQKEAT